MTNAREKTGPQTVQTLVFGEPNLSKTDGGITWYKKARKMRRDPTIALARALVMAPALASNWSIEALDDAPDGAQDFIDKHLQSVRLHLLKTAMSGMIDFGWQPFEKVFSIDRNGLIYVSKFKALLHDITEILVIEETGAFNGFENSPPAGGVTILQLPFSLLFSNDPEGTDWYGQALLRNSEAAYDEWSTINKAANRYDKKIAGSHWVVHYPLGNSDYDGRTDVANDEIAKDILTSLEASGAIALPRKVEALTEDLNDQAPDAWKIEILSDPGSSRASFIDRQKYLDALKVRGLELPERSVLEGEFGTKAEAEAHANFAITNIELRHQMLVQVINWHVVNQLLRFNWGEEYENTVSIVPTPLSDPTVSFLKEIYRTLLGNPDGFLEEVDRIDKDALKDKLGIPIAPEQEPILDDVIKIAEEEAAGAA